MTAAFLAAAAFVGPAAAPQADGRFEAGPQVAAPFQAGPRAVAANRLDYHVLERLKQRGLSPANPCSDEVFVRRVHLDAIGTLPEPQVVRRFLRDPGLAKRAELIDQLLERPEFADLWALKWCDLLRVKAEFPINLWPNAVQAYHKWIRDAIRDNMPFDRFARLLLTSSGSNFRVPPVNFYRAVQGREPSAAAAAAALAFMGVRTEYWPAERRAGFEALFSRIAFKSTAEWKEEIVLLDPAPAGPLDAVLPDGTQVIVPPGEDPREVFADWLTAPGNPWFAKNIANRIWAWLLGRGIVHEPDDIRPDNPPVHPELLECLEQELIASGFDLKHLFRLILNSRTYQQSSIPQSDHPEAEAYFACYPVRRLDAEVLIDALCWLSGAKESYVSPIPEPFTYIPEEHRAIELSDGSITSQFLELFGRPSRDAGLESERDNEPTEAQVLHLLNSSHVQQKIDKSWRLRGLVASAKGDRRFLISGIYLAILSRFPTEAELAAAGDYFDKSGLDMRQAANDLAWALINTKEFLYRH